MPTETINWIRGHRGLVSSGQNQTQMPTDRRFEDREQACLVCLEEGDFMAEDPKSSTSQNRF